MDPRHPENAIWRMRQLMEQFQSVMEKLNTETISSKLGEAEREGALVVQEICLVAPRMHEAMMQTSRQRRHDLAHSVIEAPVETPKPGMMDEETAKKIVDAIEKVAPKTKKKATKKKKAE